MNGQLLIDAVVQQVTVPDEERQLLSVLHDLVESGLVFRSGSGAQAAYRAASEAELGELSRLSSEQGLEEWLWVLVYRDGPFSESELAERSALLGFWEAAVLDHLKAVVQTVCQRLQLAESGTAACSNAKERRVRIRMKTNERVRRLSRGRAVAVALLVGACGGTVGQAPILGSESHFLAYCDSTCDAGLECIGGICTRSCLTDTSSCSDLGGGAQCTNQSVEPGQVAVCDVSCAQGSDCAALGTGYGCDNGYCRSKASPVVSTSDETPENAGGSAGSGGSEAVDSAVCDAFRDHSPPPDIRVISIVNTGSVPLYIVPAVLDCPSPTSLVEVGRDGQSVNTFGIPDCRFGCQQVMDEGWLYGTGPVPGGCSTLCNFRPPVMIGPGQTLSQPVQLEVVQKRLPQSCAQGLPGTIDCFSRVIPQPGNYTLTVRAAVNLECSPGVDCECQPDAAGICTNPNIFDRELRAGALAFSSPSDWYFQNQVLNIAAPAQ